MKEGEKISSYMNRLINLNKKRQKQLDDFRIKNIKDNLHYVESTESVLHVISPEIKQKIIKELNSEIKENWDNLKLLSANASIQRIVDTWRSMCIGSNDDLPPSLSEELLSQLERYNSSHKPKLEEVKIDPLFCDSSFIQTDYKVDFKYEPVYRWLSIASPTDFVQSLPRNGGIISFNMSDIN